MVYANRFVLLRFNGHFGSSSSALDNWSVGMKFGIQAQDPPYDAAKLQTLVNAAQTAANTFHGSSSVFAGTATYLDFVSGALLGLDGKYEPSSQLTVLSPTITTAGAGTTSNLPWNTASVISLRTARPRGTSSNGRVYWPACAGGIVPTTGRMQASAVTGRLGAAATFLTALNTAANVYAPGMRLSVLSARGAGNAAQVTHIRIDERLDSIERRENNQPAVWQTATI